MLALLASAWACAFPVFGALPAPQRDELPGAPFQSPALQASLGALDPSRAGWTSEVRAEAARLQLEKVGRFLETPGADPGQALAGVFAEGFSCPDETAPIEDVFADAAFRVRRRGKILDFSASDRDGFFTWFAAPLRGSHAIQTRFEILHVGEGPDGFTTDARLDLSATGPEGPLQLETCWRCLWIEKEGKAPEMTLLGVLDYEEVSGRGAKEHTFADCSAALFGANAAWSEELLPGLSSWRARLDTRLGLPLLGHAAGIAIGDVDGDGLEDVYLCQPGGLPNKLFVHRPDGTTLDRSAEAGVDFLDSSRAALLIDLDNDGDRDLVVSAAERLLFLSNDGQAHFWLESALPAPDATSLAAADFDLDGDLDVYVCASSWPCDRGALPVPCVDANNGSPNLLLENRGDWIFADVTRERGLDQNNRRFSFAASWEDYDRDGDPDLCVANEFARNNLFRNDGGKFVDVAAAAGVADVAAGSGVTWGDADGDGRFDLFVSGWYSAAGNRIACQPRFQSAASDALRREFQRQSQGNTLLRNLGDGTFRDATGTCPIGIRNGRWAWGAQFCDLNQDGWPDLLVPSGLLTEEKGDDLAGFFWREVAARSPFEAGPGDTDAYAAGWAALSELLRCGFSWSGREPNGAFLNRNGRGFADVSSVSGLDFAGDARAAALCDWDGDGDQDVFVTSRAGPRVRFLRNDQATGNEHLTLELRGRTCNRDAIGARVEVALTDARGELRTLVRGVRAGEGCLAQGSTRLTLGLGAKPRVERVLVHWPGGADETFTGVDPGAAWRLVQGSGRAEALPSMRAQRALASSKPVVAEAGAAARVVLARPVPLPKLALAAADGSALELFGIQAGGAGTGTGKPLLLLLFSSSSASCAQELGELAPRARELEATGLAVLALSTDALEERDKAAAFLAERGWTLPWGVASPAALEFLDALQDLLLDRERRLSLPASFLVDAAGAVRALHLGALTARDLDAGRELVELGEGALLEAATPFAGRWMFPALPSDADFFAQRLDRRGLAGPAREFERGRIAVVRSTPADLLQDFGRRSAAAGRLDEAENFFRSALAADPGHFGALTDLAIVLHREEKLAAAAELYRKALALRPDHADTHFNLALAELGLGERAAAGRQLAWLRAHGAESASVLEQALKQADAAPR